ncbi:myotubularin-related protein 10-A-like isoform X2 [Saccostrea echinata]|uniref:myotubularin-related protein 10-A-like isoform X2 n=1 Tax=Saccostrea echinata TaxID=191078 RepID=UPI002A7EB711|nr:myotubularin-related protein 10-A-like isoform X2 [Saccostrea echinata]
MSSFISYISRNEKESGKETFKSYVDQDEDETDDEIKKRASSFFQNDLIPRLLPGERVVTEADSVLCFVPFTEKKQGTSGKLFITNFKLTFLTGDRSSYEKEAQRQRNKIIDDGDIPLTNIESIYQVVSGGKRRKLLPNTTVSTLTKYLEIHCKDFRTHVFGFKFSPKDQIKKITNAVIHYAYPNKSYLLYAFEYAKALQTPENGTVSNTPRYDCAADWERELNRCGCTKWTVCEVNQGYCVSQSMPERFVLPMNLMSYDELMKAASQFNENRLPAWCYTHTSGASLVRMAEMYADSDLAGYVGNLSSEMYIRTYCNRLRTAIQLADVNKGYPVEMDLTKLCPSLKDIQGAYEKLKDLIFIDSGKDFAVQDISWLSSLEGTKWLTCVSQCLKTACDAAEHMKRHTVIIKEPDSRHYCCLISSLVQILLDRYFRTRIGFQSLIQREWVAMGYPFQREGCLVQDLNRPNNEYIPLFLLFLDCVWQLMGQYPSAFAFSETYLVTLWDSVHMGIFETFLFDSYHQRTRYHIDGRWQQRFCLPSVWDWQIQFSNDDQSFFNNPLYIMKTNPDVCEALTKSKNLESSLRHKISIKKLYSYELQNFEESNLCSNAVKSDRSTRLTPLVGAACMKLWSQCYLRWQTPAQIIGGGNPSQYLQQCVMVEEILCLLHKLEVLNKNSAKSVNSLTRTRSDLVFSMALDTPRTTELLANSYLTSSFPFSSAQRLSREEKSVFTPISLFLEHSNIDYDYSNDDD